MKHGSVGRAGTAPSTWQLPPEASGSFPSGAGHQSAWRSGAMGRRKVSGRQLKVQKVEWVPHAYDVALRAGAQRGCQAQPLPSPNRVQRY